MHKRVGLGAYDANGVPYLAGEITIKSHSAEFTSRIAALGTGDNLYPNSYVDTYLLAEDIH